MQALIVAWRPLAQPLIPKSHANIWRNFWRGKRPNSKVHFPCRYLIASVAHLERALGYERVARLARHSQLEFPRRVGARIVPALSGAGRHFAIL